MRTIDSAVVSRTLLPAHMPPLDLPGANRVSPNRLLRGWLAERGSMGWQSHSSWNWMRNCCQKLARTTVPHHRAVCSTAADRTRQGRIVSPFHPDCVSRTCRIRWILGFWNSIYWLPKRTLLERFFFFALTWSWDANPRHCNSVLPFTTTTTQPHPLVKPNTPKVIHNKLKVPQMVT